MYHQIQDIIVFQRFRFYIIRELPYPLEEKIDCLLVAFSACGCTGGVMNSDSEYDNRKAEFAYGCVAFTYAQKPLGKA